MLIDQAKIYVSGGRGGKGCQSLYKDLFHRRGIPDGGDGGSGGNVIVKCDENLNTLLKFRYNQHHSAPSGKHGGSNKKFGRRGKDLVLKVPVGTIVRNAEDNLIIRDLSTVGEEVIAAKGGAGGLGNAKGLPATPGKEPETKTLLLELKLASDAGIIGFPNAGKSTLISLISSAHSKIAPYPFTTKTPKLGVVKFFDDSFVIADMPGLIEGAHAGRGLGDRFLRHIERTRVLVHVVDIAPIDGADPVKNYLQLEEELKLYDQNVYEKPRVVAANKMDMVGAAENLKKLKSFVYAKVWEISALTGEGTKELIAAIYGEIKNVKKKTEENNDQDWYESSDGHEQ